MRPPTAVLVSLPSLPLVSHHTKLLARILPLLLIAFVFTTGLPLSAQTTFTVTNTNDGGTGSLRQAIVDINSSCFDSAGCYIAFNLGPVPPAGYHTIALASALPNVYKMNTHVDGTTQPGYAGVPVVVIDGSGAGVAADGLTVNTFSTGDGMGILVSGLGIQNFSGAAIRTRTGFAPPTITITGNDIGISPDGTPAPNGSGIAIESANWSTINQNRIAYSAADAITIASGASGISIGPNSIYANGFGIDLLGTDGPTANDVGDSDTGGNTLTNFPLLTALIFDGTTTTVSGTLAGAGSAMYDIDLYENSSADPSGYGQGESWAGESLGVATDVSGNATFSIALSGDHTAMHFTATATWNEGSVGPWHTSEFSPAYAASDLSITKTDGVTSLPTGGTTTYTIEARNFGPGAVTGATIDDTITSLFSAATWTCSATAGSSVAPATGTGSISATANLAADGVITCLLTATLDPFTTGSITNTATITAPVGAADPVLTNNTASDTNTIDPLPPADLAITKDDGLTTVVAGAAVTYTIVVSNSGPNPVTGASISDTPPPELINVTWTCAASGGAVCLTGAGTGSISTTGNIPVGGLLTYTLQATADPSLMGGSIVNSAVVSVPSGMSDPNSANDIATDVDSLTSSADLQVTIVDAPDPVSAGGTINYSITATNAGPSDATLVSLTLTFDAALTGTSIGTLPSGWSCSGSAPIFICSASTFPAGSVLLTASATAPAVAGTYTTTAAIVASMPPDPVTGNDSASAATTVAAEADLGISKTDGVTSLIAGNDTTYTIVVYNNGPSDVTGATITDTAPGSLANVSWSCLATTGSACGAASGVGSIATTADIAYLGSVTYTLAATLDANATGTLNNTASAVSSTVADPVSTNNSATDTDAITGEADLSVAITDSPDPVLAATPLTYTIAVTNSGPSAAQGVTLTLTPDAALTAVAVTPPAGWSCSGTSPVQCTAATLAVGSAILTVSAIAPAEGGTCQTFVSVAGTTGDPIPSNNGPAGASTVVTSSANISITKTDGVTSIAPGATTTYTIAIGNAGPSFASGVVVADPIAAPLSGASWTCSATAGSACGAAAGTGSLSTNADVAVGGTVTYLLTATLAPAATGSVTNSASVSSSILDPVPTNNSASDTDTIVSAIADLRICRTSGTVVVTGTSLTYTLVASNGGPSAVTGARLMDIVTIVPFGGESSLVAKSGRRIAPRLAGATWTCSASPGSACAASSGTGDVDVLLNLVAGGSATVLVTVPIAADASGLISLTTAVTPPSSVTDTTPGNNAIRLNIPIRQKADLAIVKGHTGTPSAGDTVAYTIIASNLGPGTANGARVTDILPPELTVLSWTCAGSGGATCGSSSGSGDIDALVDLPPGSQAVFSLSAILSDTATGSVTNSASITSPFSTSDANLENNYAADPLGVAPCLLAPQPLAPVEDVLTDVTNVEFAWSDVGAASYEVFISVNGGAFASEGTATTAHLTLPVAPGEIRWFVVATAGSCSVTGPIAAFTVESCLAPATPVPSLVGQVNSGEPYTFSWTTEDPDVVFEYRESPLESFPDATWTSTSERSITLAYVNDGASPAALWYQVRAWRTCPNGSLPSSESIPVRVAVLPANVSSDSATLQEGDDDPVSQLVRLCLNAQQQVVSCNAGLQSTSSVVPLDTPVTIGTDRSWMTVTPSSTNVPPGGTLVTVTASPLGLPTGTNTGSIVVTQSNGQVSNVPFSLNIVSPVTPVAKTPPPADALIIPAVAHADGAGSRWQSDVRLTNASLQKVAYELAFTPSGADASLTSKKTTIEMAAGETKAFDDIVRQWFGNGALSDGTSGVLDIRPAPGPKAAGAGALLASSRTYNATANGTYGQWIPAVPFSRFIGRGTGGAQPALSMQQVTQSSRYRTNLGLVEAAGFPAIVRVTIFDARGVSLDSFDVNLGAMEHRQINSALASRNLTLENGRIETRVLSGDGRITAYASVIDTSTNDPILVPGVETSLVKSSRFVMPGVADLDTGRNHWRTDLRVFNPSDTAVALSLVFYEQNEPSNHREAQLTVAPGNVAILDDSLESLFAVSNAGGAIHFLTGSEQPLIITGRTFDQQAAGTYGQFIPAVTPGEAVGLGERALEIQQLEQSDRYRTNVGVAEVTGDGVEVELTAIVPGTTVAPTLRLTLDPNEFTQLNGVLQQMGLGNAYNARLSIKVIGGGGRVSAYGSIIDQRTNDPTYVPGQ